MGEEVACQSCEDFKYVCVNYIELNSPTRRSTNAIRSPSYCDLSTYSPNSKISKISRDWKGTGWYRITGEAGTKLIVSPVDMFHCGTATTGWLSGGHPTVDEGEVARTVNFNWASNSSKWSADANVINCNTHYVYYLVDAPHCHLGY